MDCHRRAGALPARIGEEATAAWVRCLFLTSIKLRIIVKRPRKYPRDYPKEPKTLGERIRKHRMDLGLFQKDVAKFIGVTTDTVTYWEKGRYQPSKKYLKKIEEFLERKSSCT